MIITDDHFNKRKIKPFEKLKDNDMILFQKMFCLQCD